MRKMTTEIPHVAKSAVSTSVIGNQNPEEQSGCSRRTVSGDDGVARDDRDDKAALTDDAGKEGETNAVTLLLRSMFAENNFEQATEL
jgi:hypothetical protein